VSGTESCAAEVFTRAGPLSALLSALLSVTIKWASTSANPATPCRCEPTLQVFIPNGTSTVTNQSVLLMSTNHLVFGLPLFLSPMGPQESTSFAQLSMALATWLAQSCFDIFSICSILGSWVLSVMVLLSLETYLMAIIVHTDLVKNTILQRS